jgi:hypothetical protein
MNNEYNGQGGSYNIGADGNLVLVERTRERADEPPAPPAPPAPAEPDTQPEPADAGFFVPEAPADQPTAE